MSEGLLSADELSAITADAIEAATDVMEATLDRARVRTIRGRPLGGHQAAAHLLVDRWLAVAAVRAAANRVGVGGDAALAVALGAVESLGALCDDALRLRGAMGYLVDDVAAQGRLRSLDLVRRLGRPDDVLRHLGRTDRDPVRRQTDTDQLVQSVLAPVWDDGRAAEAEVAGILHDPAVHAAVAGAGWLGVFVAHARLAPQLEPDDAFSIAESLILAGVPIHALNTTAMAATLVRDLGSEHLVEHVLPDLVDGRGVVALGYTEPQGGSDLASVATVAETVGGRWRLSGTKLYCTLAEVADHVLVLARTEPGSERHRGLTLFLVPNHAAGMAVRVLPTHGGEATTELVLDHVDVGPEHVVGEVDHGWSAAMVAMRYERNASPWCDGLRLLGLADRLGELEVGGCRLGEDAGWCRAVGGLYVDLILGRGLVDVLLTDSEELGPGAPSAVKLFTTESLTASARRLVASVPAALVDHVLVARLEAQWRRSISLTIAGGPSEVQRDILAVQALGLPRS